MKKELQDLHLETHVKIHTLLLLGGLIVTGIGGKISEFGRLHVVAWIGILLIVLSMLWRFLFIKCPHCGSKLYSVRELPEYCPDCGEKLV
ncbi:MAG: hypothetical protein IJN67_08215 [Oscillospiraceae bacterium]|nr:hypothetical protein [Oscillospiraceae bacterium]